VGGTTLNGMEIGCREETEWLNRAPSRDGGKEGYITAPEQTFFFFIRNSLFGARLPFFKLSIRILVSPIFISDLVDSRVSSPFLEILIVSLVIELRFTYK